MAAISAFMASNQRPYPTHYMETSITTYLNACRYCLVNVEVFFNNFSDGSVGLNFNSAQCSLAEVLQVIQGKIQLKMTKKTLIP